MAEKTEKKSIKISLPITTVSDVFLSSLPKILINPEEIPIIKNEAELIPFMHDKGILCPICPADFQGTFILMGQVNTLGRQTRAYLFLCTRCRNVSYLPVTKQGVFKVDYHEQRRRSIAEVSNPLLAQFSTLQFDFDEFIMQTAGVNYKDVLISLKKLYESTDFVSKVKKVPVPPATVKK